MKGIKMIRISMIDFETLMIMYNDNVWTIKRADLDEFIKKLQEFQNLEKIKISHFVPK